MKRVLVASMMHESNSFNPIIAGENDFGVVRGEKLFERNPKNDPLRGVMDTLQEQGYEVVPTLFASAVPNGEVDYEFYLGLKEEILERARQAQEEKAAGCDHTCTSRIYESERSWRCRGISVGRIKRDIPGHSDLLGTGYAHDDDCPHAREL